MAFPLETLASKAKDTSGRDRLGTRATQVQHSLCKKDVREEDIGLRLSLVRKELESLEAKLDGILAEKKRLR